MTGRYRTVVIGFGKIGAGFADDPVMARMVRYATHAQVLARHPRFDWQAVIDVSDDALYQARERWHVPHTAHHVGELPSEIPLDLAVIATPPRPRNAILRHLSGVRAVLVEKPLGATASDAQEFLEECDRRGILVQVNLWRRGDQLFRELSEGRLRTLIGVPQTAFGVYGNGLVNNGTHLIDFARMLVGDVAAVQSTGSAVVCPGSSVPDDFDISFAMRMRDGMTVAVQPVTFRKYREVSLDIWGEDGRLAIMNEGLSVQLFRRNENRAVSGQLEVASEGPVQLPPTVGEALFRMYDNLADAMDRGASLWSPGRSALATSKVIDGIRRSAADRGAMVEL